MEAGFYVGCHSPHHNVEDGFVKHGCLPVSYESVILQLQNEEYDTGMKETASAIRDLATEMELPSAQPTIQERKDASPPPNFALGLSGTKPHATSHQDRTSKVNTVLPLAKAKDVTPVIDNRSSPYTAWVLYAADSTHYTVVEEPQELASYINRGFKIYQTFDNPDIARVFYDMEVPQVETAPARKDNPSVQAVSHQMPPLEDQKMPAVPNHVSNSGGGHGITTAGIIRSTGKASKGIRFSRDRRVGPHWTGWTNVENATRAIVPPGFDVKELVDEGFIQYMAFDSEEEATLG